MRGLRGLGPAAGVAWCAGAILGFLGGLTITGLASTILFGVAGLAGLAGLAVVAVAGASWWAIWRRRRTGSPTADQPVFVAQPAAKASR